MVSCAVSSPGMISTSFMICAGLKKCIPITLPGRFVAAAISLIESAEVLLAMMAVSGSTASSSPSTSRLTFIFSGTASMTMSTSAKPS